MNGRQDMPAITRRCFIQASLLTACTAVASSSVAGPLGSLAAPPTATLYRVVFDREALQAIEFGAVAKARGNAVHALGTDIGPLWRQELLPQWRKGSAVVAGLTRYDALFCLEQIARDHGMRVRFRGEHRLDGRGGVIHELTGPGNMLAAAGALASAGGCFGAPTLALVAGFPVRPSSPSRQIIGGRAGASRESSMPALYSWVIA